METEPWHGLGYHGNNNNDNKHGDGHAERDYSNLGPAHRHDDDTSSMVAAIAAASASSMSETKPNSSSSVPDLPQASGASQSLCSIEAEAQKGRSRALDILALIQAETIIRDGDHADQVNGGDDHGSVGGGTENHALDTSLPPPPLHSIHPPPEDYAQKRRACLEWLDDRKKRALHQNLEYVARREEERIHERLHQIQQAQSYEQQVEIQYQQRLRDLQQHRRKQQEQEQATLSSQPGGDNNLSDNRRQQEKPQKRQRQEQRDETSTVAIYISGLPTCLSELSSYGDGGSLGNDGVSDRGGTTLKNELIKLFGCFGPLRKVHVYTHKDTGRWKGDALAIYESPPTPPMDTPTTSFVDSVCSQVRTPPRTDNHHYWCERRTMAIL